MKQIVLDKTGTLTEGRPVVCEIEAIDVSEQELLAIAAAAEASSEHPLAQAVSRRPSSAAQHLLMSKHSRRFPERA